MSSPDVTVVVVTHNSAEVVERCLASLRGGLKDVDGAVVVVVDNESSDDTLALVADLPGVAVVALGANRGYSAGINAALRAHPPARAAVVLNPDVELEEGAIIRLLDGLAEEGVGIAVPRLVDADGRTLPSMRREPSILRAAGEAVLGGRRAGRFVALGEVVVDPEAYRSVASPDWATGAVMAISADCLADVGPWDESFFLYSEETDFALRARDAGYTVRFDPEACALHTGGESNTSPELWSILTKNRIRLYRRRHGRLPTLAFSLAVVLNEFLRAIAGRPTARAAIRGLRSAHSAVPRSPAYVFFSAQDYWYFNRSHSDFQLARRIADERTVLFVNSIGMRFPTSATSTQPWRRIARKLRSTAKLLRRPEADRPAFHVLSPILLPMYKSERGRRWSAAIIRLQVRVVLRLLGERKPVIIATIPTAVTVVEGLPNCGLVFNRSDKHSSFQEVDGLLIGRLEQVLLRRSDHVLYVSHALMKEDRELAGDRAYFLDHGVDVEHFAAGASRPEPEDLAAIPHPRLGFFGGLDDYIIDFDLIEAVARRLPDAHVVLIGKATCPMDRFDAIPNVHWLGFRDYADIPAYGARFDVALMPWLQNEWIAASNPIKLKEYLALGLPIVSTPFGEADRYGGLLDVCRDHDEFGAAVERRLRHPAADAQWRRDSVAGESWVERAREIINLCEKELGPRCAAS